MSEARPTPAADAASGQYYDVTATAPGTDVPAVLAAAALGPVPADVDINAASLDAAVLYSNGCHLSWSATSPNPACVFGDLDSDIVVVLTGDSHAAHWFAGLEVAAIENGWQLVSVTKSGCPAADVPVYSAEERHIGQAVVYEACATWRTQAMAYIAALQPDVVVFPTLTRRGVIGSPGPTALPAWYRGLESSVRAAQGPTPTGVVILADTPKTIGVDIPSCIRTNMTDISACANTTEAAWSMERSSMLATLADRNGWVFDDPALWMCTDQRCPVVHEDAVVYRDSHHLTDRFSRSQADRLADAVAAALASR